MINIAVIGYGNVGRGVITALKKNPDMRLSAVFTRRPEPVQQQLKDTPVFGIGAALPKGLNIDVGILCGGSKEDVPVQGPQYAKLFCTVDSFDTHADIPDYFKKMDATAKSAGNVSIISAGWDPGIFSLERVIGEAFLPGSTGYTFWGPGVSQGHSDAARTIDGVADARQYTIPIESALQTVRSGQKPSFTKRQMHKRVVYVVAKPGADKEKIRKTIVEMPNYYSDYEVEVNFISADEMSKKHASYPHGGFVMTSGVTGSNNVEILEYRCQLTSNPEFTGSVLVACARAASRMKGMGWKGAYTMLDFPLGLMSMHSGDEIRHKFI